MALLDSGKIVPCTLFLPDFCLVFETGSGMKLTMNTKHTKSKFPRYTVPEKRGRHRHGRCSHPLVASASGWGSTWVSGYRWEVSSFEYQIIHAQYTFSCLLASPWKWGLSFSSKIFSLTIETRCCPDTEETSVTSYVDFIIHVCFVWVCMYLTIGLRTPNQLAWAWDRCEPHFTCYIEGTNTITLQRYYYFGKNVMKFIYRGTSMYS